MFMLMWLIMPRRCDFHPLFDTDTSHMLCLLTLIPIMRTTPHSSASQQVHTVATRLQQLMPSRPTGGYYSQPIRKSPVRSVAAITKRPSSPQTNLDHVIYVTSVLRHLHWLTCKSIKLSLSRMMWL